MVLFQAMATPPWRLTRAPPTRYPSGSMKIRITTNLIRLGNATPDAGDFDFKLYQRGGAADAVRLFFRTFRDDYILLNGHLRTAYILALLKIIIPFHRPRFVLVDVLLSTPVGWKGRLKAWFVGRLLRRVHRIMLYYRNTEGWQRHYRIPADRFEYIPFKLNSADTIRRAAPTDGGYVFCGGKTRRDFATLFKAVEGLDIPVRVVTTANSDISPHGSWLDEASAPDNVEVVRLDGSAEPFIAHMALARLVVQPIIPEISGAGMSVYIMAMALRKCVITTQGPGADDVLTEGQAIIVPASDPAALRTAIVKAFFDADYRAPYEKRGYEYAMSCGEEEQLYRTILSRLHADYLEWRQGDPKRSARS
jgi:glycosyltransferase involved in cell wall biosynthesis